MDSNCVNNYLGHALRAKCWHSLHIHACQKRQTRRTWKSLCAQLIQRLHKDLLHRSQGWKKRFRRSWLARKCAYVAATRLSGIISACGRTKSPHQRNPTRKARKTKGVAATTSVTSLGVDREEKSAWFLFDHSGNNCCFVWLGFGKILFICLFFDGGMRKEVMMRTAW